MKITKFFVTLFLLKCLNGYAQELPIMAFHSFTPETSTLKNFTKFKEAGFNINHTIFKNNTQLQAALDLASKAGIKMMVYSDELINDTENTVRKFKNHPALYGYFLGDEPSPSDFGRLKQIREKIKKLDPVHPIYINLYPNYAPADILERYNYKSYVDQYLEKINTDFISFDNYPIVNNKVRSDWYDNLEIIRNAAIRFRKPFWAFACTTIHNNYKQPTLAGLKLQQFSNLLYGAKGLQYFTYITMDDEYWKKNNYSYSIIYNNGQPTPTYNLVKSLNTQIRNLSWIFTKSKVDSVFHTGDTIPVGTKRMDFMPKAFKSLKTLGRSALISFQSIGSKKFVIIQNKDIQRSLPLNFELNPKISIVNSATGKESAASTQATVTQIAPGDIMIFTYY